MIKYTFLLFNLFAFLFFGVPLLQKGISVTHDPPEKIVAGKKETVTLTIKKEGISGFAKLQIDVEEGLKIEPVDKAGASFSFEEGKAKFIWMAMPNKPEFSIQYRLIAEEGVTGKKSIKGNFNYIKESARKSEKIKQKTVEVITEEEKEMASSEEDTTSEKTTAQKDTAKTGGEEGMKEPEVIVKRRIEKVEDRIFRVRITIDKGGVTGFAKMQDVVPEGFAVNEGTTSGSVFSFQDQKAKFVWMNLPKKAELNVDYKVISKESKRGDFTIDGTFSYLVNGNTRKTNPEPDTFTIKAPEVAKAGGKEEKTEGSEQQGEDKEEKEEGTEEEEVASKEKGDGSEKGDKDVVTGGVPGPEKGIGYKVQICAGHDPVKDNHFGKVYDYQGEYEIEHHEGWLKYTTGDFNVYKQARDKREYYRSNFEFPGPFVTAYNEGKRITVQEALMISDQKWMP